MKDALTALERRFAVKADVSDIGLAMDAAYARQIVRELKSVREEFVHEYFSTTFDYANVTAMLRLKRMKAPKDVYQRAMLEGGRIEMLSLMHAYDMDDDEAIAYLTRGRYSREIGAAYEY